MADDDRFFSRWARRKAEVQRGDAPAEAKKPGPAGTDLPVPVPVPVPVSVPVSVQVRAEGPVAVPGALQDANAPQPPAAAPEAPPLPTMQDVVALTRESDYSPFVARGVDSQVRNAAMKKLFSDPHFNIMDGLDTYIDDYNTPDPLPASMLRKMAQSKFLGLFDDEEKPQAVAAAATEAEAPVEAPDEASTHAPDVLASTDGATPADPSSSPTVTQAVHRVATEPENAPDEDPALRLQPHDAPGQAGDRPGTADDGGKRRR
jgi:hypothetical protein